MRIQLDYYRILGLTPQAKVEHINQAHSDRIKSLPRREYADKAISARQKLLDVAHNVLADSSQRQVYDAQILPGLIKSTDNQAFFIEIDKRDFSGALLILYELGEYDQIISLSEDAPNPSDPDFILSIALAHLELGREHWNQGKYEAASKNFNNSISILEKKSGLFLEIEEELQRNIWQLRPYRILELMSSGSTNAGLALLQELLDRRRGIDGRGDDRSGLNIDRFLQFILELRIYMTSAEQEQLFEREALRPSQVASYLAVYALIAKGVSQNQPQLIDRAKSLLERISSSQNLYLEEAICALLLGQVSEATRILEMSNEVEKVAVIHKLSEPERDLFKGLYRYTQTWLATEIYPNFKDLSAQSVDLEAYFNDRHVQTYINELPNTSPLFSSSNSEILDLQLPASQVLMPDPFLGLDSELNSSNYISEPISSVSSVSSKSFKNVSEDISDRAVTAERTSRSETIASPYQSRSEARSKTAKSRAKSKYKFHPERFILFLVGCIGLVGGSVALAYMAWFNSPKQPIALSEPVLTPIINASIANIKSIEIDPKLANIIDQKVAAEIVNSWQTIKADSLGKRYNIKALDQILTEPLASEWRSRAEDLKSTNSHVEYTLKSLVIKEFKSIDKDRAMALTNVSEVRNYFTNGQLDKLDSKADSYEVEYVLTRQNNQWMISAMNLKP